LARARALAALEATSTGGDEPLPVREPAPT
jgi:hypothetical protein